MRRAALLIVLLATAAATPVQAQTRDSELDILRAKLEAALAHIEQLETRLNVVEGHTPPAASVAAAAPVAQAAAAAPPAAKDSDDAIDLADLPRANEQNGLPVAGGSRSWTLAPPGPIDEPLRPVGNGHAAAFELLAGTGSGRASFTFSQSKDRGDAPGATATAVYNDTFTLSLSAPLAKDGDTSFATLDGLATGSKLEFGYTQFRGRVLTQAQDSRHPLLIRARQRCREQVPAYKPGCVRLDDDFKRLFFTPTELDAYERDYARQTIQQSLAWSLRAAVGYDEFSYYPAPSLTKATDRKVSWSVGGGLALFPFDRSSASLNLDYQRAFKARKAQATCPVAAAGATFVTCVPGPLMGPELTSKLILAPELRYIQPLSESGLIRDLGFAPRVEFDLLADSIAFDLPIYFAADDKDGLIGGFRFGYLTEGDEFKFGIFVGKSFSLFQ